MLLTRYSDSGSCSVRLECDRHGQPNVNHFGAAREITVLCWGLPSARLRYYKWWVWKRGQGRKCALGHFSMEEGRFNLASAEGDFRLPAHAAINLEAILWSVSKAGEWPKDGRYISFAEGQWLRVMISASAAYPVCKSSKRALNKEVFLVFYVAA